MHQFTNVVVYTRTPDIIYICSLKWRRTVRCSLLWKEGIKSGYDSSLDRAEILLCRGDYCLSPVFNSFPIIFMAKTKKGKKIVEIRSHYRKLKNGKHVRVREHRKSTPN